MCEPPYVTACSTCSGTSSASGGSNAIKTQRNNGKRGARDQHVGGADARQKRARQRKQRDLRKNRDGPQRAADAGAQALLLPDQGAVAQHRRVRGLRAARRDEKRHERFGGEQLARLLGMPERLAHAGCIALGGRQPRQQMRGTDRQRAADRDEPDARACPKRSRISPPQKLAAMNVSEPHSRTRP